MFMTSLSTPSIDHTFSSHRLRKKVYRYNMKMLHSENNILADPLPIDQGDEFVALELANFLVERLKKRVSFSSTVGNSPTPNELAEEDLKNLWFSREDLAQFKYQSRRLSNAGVSDKKAFDSLRGLECNSLGRLMHKHMTVQCIVSAYKKGMSPREIAAMARVCSNWNGEVALLQACHDYFDVHQPNLASNFPRVPSTPPKFPFELKRATINTHRNARRLRRRVR